MKLLGSGRKQIAPLAVRGDLWNFNVCWMKGAEEARQFFIFPAGSGSPYRVSANYSLPIFRVRRNTLIAIQSLPLLFCVLVLVIKDLSDGVFDHNGGCPTCCLSQLGAAAEDDFLILGAKQSLILLDR